LGKRSGWRVDSVLAECVRYVKHAKLLIHIKFSGLYSCVLVKAHITSLFIGRNTEVE